MTDQYKVIWRRRVIETDVANWVLSAMQRGEDSTSITNAMNEIDRILSEYPDVKGESRGESERVLIVKPLTVYYEIHEDEKIVLVLSAALRDA